MDSHYKCMLIEDRKITCTFVFKQAKVYPSGSKYIHISGHCKDCGGQLQALCMKEPPVHSLMLFECVLKNSDDSLHSGSKCRLAGQMRENVAKDLCEDKLEPHVWRARQANELMDFGDAEPSHLPDLATLRKAKQERSDKELQHKNPVLPLQELQHSASYSGSIHDIGLDKFFITIGAKPKCIDK